MKAIFPFFLFLPLASSAQKGSDSINRNTISRQNITDSGSTTFTYDIFRFPGRSLDSVPIKNIVDVRNQVRQMDFISGKVYFSGTGFTYPIEVNPLGKGSWIEHYLINCGPGSKLAFENCRVKGSGSMSVQAIHKVIVFK